MENRAAKEPSTSHAEGKQNSLPRRSDRNGPYEKEEAQDRGRETGRPNALEGKCEVSTRAGRCHRRDDERARPNGERSAASAASPLERLVRPGPASDWAGHAATTAHLAVLNSWFPRAEGEQNSRGSFSQPWVDPIEGRQRNER